MLAMVTKDYVFLGILAVGNIPVYILIGKMLFEDWEEFKEAVGYLFTPNVFSYIFGELDEDFWATVKMFIFIVLCIFLWTGELVLITKCFY